MFADLWKARFFMWNLENSNTAIIRIFWSSPCDLELSRFYCILGKLWRHWNIDWSDLKAFVHKSGNINVILCEIFRKHCEKRRKCWVPALFLKPSILRSFVLESVPGLYSPTILQNVLIIFLQIVHYLAAFDCNTTSDWLNHTV